MGLLSNEDIDEGLRQLVRENVLVGWYSCVWTDGRQWTVRPAAGRCVTYRRDGVTAYLALAADVFAG